VNVNFIPYLTGKKWRKAKESGYFLGQGTSNTNEWSKSMESERHYAKVIQGKVRKVTRAPPEGGVRTLGFTLAKGLIRGLIRCPNPSLEILVYCPFLDVCGGSWAI